MASFNFKSFVKNIADKAQSDFSPGRRLSSTSSSGAPNPGTVDEAEGFICPTCMQGFPSPTDLQDHFETEHGDSTSNNGNLGNLKEEVQDLQTTLKEEQFYSAELKREVERLSNAVQRNNHEAIGGDDHEGMVTALQEAKELLTKEVIQLREQLESSEAKVAEGSKIAEKAAHLASQNVALKAAVDEMMGQKQVAEEKLQLLETVVAQRNNTDDVAVLRTELQNVQKIMVEDLGERKEHQLDELRHENETLKLQMVELKASCEEVNKKLTNVQEENEELKEKFFTSDSKAELLKVESGQRDKLISELQNNIEQLTVGLNGSQNELKVAMEELNSARNSSQSHLATEQSRSTELRVHLDTLQNRLNGQEGKVSDLTEELATLQRHYDEQCQTNDELKTQVCELDNSLDESGRHKTNLESECSKLKEHIATANESVARLNAEKEDLLVKIEAGEGANTALQQLKQQNENLSEQLSTSLKEKDVALTNAKAKIEALHGSVNEGKVGLSNLTEKCKKLESIKKEMTSKLEGLQQDHSKLTAELQTKAELLIASEAAKTSQRKDLEGHLQSAQANLQTKVKELEKVEAKCTESQSQLLKEKEKNAALLLKEKDLLQQHQQLIQQKDHAVQSKQKECQDLQAQLDKKQAAVQEMTVAHQKLEKEKQNVQDMCSKQKAEVDSAKVQLDKLNSSHSVAIQDFKAKEKAANELIGQLKESVKSTASTVEQQTLELQKLASHEKSLLQELEEARNKSTKLQEESGSLSTNLKAKEDMLQTLNDTCTSMEEKIDSLNSCLEEANKEKGEAEEKVCKLQTMWETDKAKQEEKMSDLEKAKELLLNSKVELQSNLEQVRCDMVKVQKELEGSKKDRSKLIASHTFQMSEMSTKMDKLVADHKKVEESLLEDKMGLEATIESCKEEATASKTKASEAEGNLSQVSSQLDIALSERLELEAKVESASDERRSLLERCLGAESELDRSRSTIVELRRKLDDSQAALHELGRENQSIQVELAKQTGRKWADDAEASCCQTCGSNFTITNRKHHCRNCGQIFCAECSSKQTTMANYKKPQRVCDNCYTELQQAK